MLRTVRDNLSSALFPQLCLCCRERLTAPSTGYACAECWEASSLFIGDELLCGKCGKPEVAGRSPKCPQCEEHEYDIARAVGIYSNALRAAVVSLKTHPHVSAKLKELIVEAAKRYGFTDPDLIVPVPLSKQRNLERGFNQAEIISHALGKRIGSPVDARSLIRSKHSPIHRVGMDEKARDMSVRDGFRVVRPKLIEGRNILLVDDVLTTGATASYCAQTLKRSGAKRVNVLTIARAI